jgi:hypothetical protein
VRFSRPWCLRARRFRFEVRNGTTPVTLLFHVYAGARELGSRHALQEVTRHGTRKRWPADPGLTPVRANLQEPAILKSEIGEALSLHDTPFLNHDVPGHHPERSARQTPVPPRASSCLRVATALCSPSLCIRKKRGLHHNPVKRRLVSSPDQWPWSSFRLYYLNDSSVLTIDHLV